MTEEILKEKDSLENNIIKTISNKHISVLPKWHFVLKIALFIIGTILIALTTLFLASLIVFSMRQSGLWFMPGFGAIGLLKFVGSLPWLLIVTAGLFIIILGALIKKYSFSYGKPLLYSAIGIIIFAGLGGFFIALTPFHALLLDQADNKNLPFAGNFYEQFGRPEIEGTVRGTITKIDPNTIIIQNQKAREIIILLNENTRMPRRPLKISDEIIALGEKTEEAFEAIGIELMTGRHGIKPMMPPRLNRPF